MSALLTTATAADTVCRENRIAVLPIGSFEQHGDHLPLITDTAIACVIADRIATAYDLFLLPPITIACSQEHEGFPGTVSIGAKTLIAIVDDVIASLARAGITKLVLANGHGGNYVLSNVVVQHNATGRNLTLFPTSEDWNIARIHASMQTSGHDDMHGGELETSLLLHAHPQLVGASYATADNLAGDRRLFLITRMAGYTTSGIIGRPSLATKAKGKAAVESLVESFADHLKILTE